MQFQVSLHSSSKKEQGGAALTLCLFPISELRESVKNYKKNKKRAPLIFSEPHWCSRCEGLGIAASVNCHCEYPEGHEMIVSARARDHARLNGEGKVKGAKKFFKYGEVMDEAKVPLFNVNGHPTSGKHLIYSNKRPAEIFFMQLPISKRICRQESVV